MRRAVLSLILPLVATTAGCFQMGEDQRQKLRRAGDLYRQQQVDEAIHQLDPVIQNAGGTAEVAEAYYLRGLCRAEQGRFKQAAADLKQAIARSVRDDLTVQAKASLAAVRFQQDDWKAAADLYDDVVGRLANSPPTDQILFYAGQAMQRAGRWKQARAQFGRILWKFASSPVKEDARRMAGWQHEYFAVQLAAFEDTENAENAVQRFRANSGLDFVQMMNQPWRGSVLWIITAGRYPTYDDALKALPKVRRIAPDAYIVP
jgi:tetratricopeptide (TPR) repeat protein